MLKFQSSSKEMPGVLNTDGQPQRTAEFVLAVVILTERYSAGTTRPRCGMRPRLEECTLDDGATPVKTFCVDA